MPPRVTRQADGTRGDTRETVDLTLLQTRPSDGQLPDVCQQTSISVAATDMQKVRQPLIFGTANHSGRYRSMRNSQEGFHGFSKDTAHEAIGDAGKRRKRGIAAQTLYAAMGLLAANLRKIVSFLDVVRETDDGQLWVPRAPRDPDKAEDSIGSSGYYEYQGDQPGDVDDGPPDRS